MLPPRTLYPLFAQDESKLHLVLDYVNGGELFTHLRRRVMFLEREARFYVAEVLACSQVALAHS